LNITDIKRSLKLLIRAKIPAIMVWGASGFGKTSIIYQTAKELYENQSECFDTTLSMRGFSSNNIVVVAAPQLTVEELIGMPYITDSTIEIDKKIKGNEVAIINEIESNPETKAIVAQKALSYMRSYSILPNPAVPFGVWGIDELNRANQYVRDALLQIALEGKYLDYQLPKEWIIVTSCNPPGKDYQVQDLGPAILRRFVNLNLTVETREVVAWGGRSKKIHNSLLEFMALYPEVFNYQDNYIPKLLPNPRGFEMLSRIIPVMDDKELRELGMEIFSGVIGESNAMLLHKTLTEENIFRNIPTTKEILFKYPEARPAIKEHLLGNPIRTDILYLLIVRCVNGLQTAFKKNPKFIEQTMEFLTFLTEDVPSDMALAFIKIMDPHNNKNSRKIMTVYMQEDKKKRITQLYKKIDWKDDEVV